MKNGREQVLINVCSQYLAQDGSFVRSFFTIFAAAAAAAGACGAGDQRLGAPAAAAAAKIENLRRVRRLDGRPFRTRFDVRFELDLTSRFELDLMSKLVRNRLKTLQKSYVPRELCTVKVH